MKKRLVAFLLVLIMVLGMLPVSAFAADDGVSPQALESNETQTIKYQILYVGDEFNIGYNYGASVNKTYTCQYSTGHSGFNHSILISEFRNVGVPALKGQLDSGYEFVGWAKEAKENPTIFDFNTAGTTATQTTYTIYLVAKKTNPTPTYMYYLYYKYNDGTDSTWLTDVTDRPTAATTFTFNVNRAKLTRSGYDHIGWADKADAVTAKYTGGDPIVLTKDNPTKTIYAVWMPFFELKYDANGGTGAPASQTRTAAHPTVNRVTFTVPNQTPSKEGYTFKGWADSATATTAQYQPGGKIAVNHADSPKTIYAVWECSHVKDNDGNCTVPGCTHPDSCCPKPEDPKPDVIPEPNPDDDNPNSPFHVWVKCITPNSGHSSGFLPISYVEGGYTRTWVEGQDTCTFVLDTQKYADFYSGLTNAGGKAHTATVPSLTQVYKYNKETGWQLQSGEYIDTTCGEVTPPTDTFTVTYTDGVDGEVFEDKVFSDLKSGEDTPAFGKDPYRDGYTFAGWEPVVAATVTETVTYVAKWTPVEPKAPTADELKKLDMAVQVKCVVDAAQQHTDAYGLLGEYDEDYFVGEPRKDGDDWLCDISYDPNLYVAEFNTTFQNLKHVQNDEKIVPVTLIWAGGSWQIKTQGRVHVTEEYTVTYTDGVDGEEVFADQVYSDLRKDSTTPAFNGTPTRTGYTFAGWEPEVAATVTQTVTYVAKWEAKKANVHLMIFKSGDLSKPIVDVPYAADKLAGDTIDLTKIDPSSYLDFDFEIDGGWYDDGMFNSYKRYLDGLQDKPAGLEKLLITGNWQNLKLIVTELVPVVYFDSLESLTAYQNDHSKTEGILRTTKARVGSALPTADAPTATRDGYTFTFWSREGQTVDVTDQTVNGWTNLYANWEANTYTVKFAPNGGEGTMADQNFTYDVEQALTANAFSRTGYTFTGWKDDGNTYTDGQKVKNLTAEPDGTVTLYAQWEAKNDTPYTVEHYLENLDGSYALDTTEPLKGTTDTTVTAAAKSYDNFTYDSTVPDTVASGNIAGDGSLVLKLFYTRNTYDYTVRHIKQLPDGSYDEENAEVETLSGKFEALAAVTAKDYGSHYPTNDADTKQNIKIEKGLTIDVKYDLDEHTLTFETNGGSAINPVTVRHGNAVARPADPTKDKYTFIGWYADPEFTEEYDFATVLEADKTIYAKFELTSTPIGDIYVRYDVLHIKQLPDGTYDLANAEVEHLRALKDSTVTAVIKDYRATHHVNVNRTLSKLTGTAIQPYKGVDGKPVYTILSVYYDLDFHTLTFDTMGGSKIAPETVRHGLTVAKPKDPVNGGYIFDGWYTDKTYRTPYNFATPLTQDTTIYAKWFLIVLPGVTVKKNTPKLNTADHFAYVQGYPNGTVKPAGNITRAETAAILFRLMDEGSRKTYYSTTSGFRDVASGSWYNTYVATLNNAGVITDSSNGYFRPNEAITRAELAAMLAKFSETTGAANYFNDVSASYWAANAIAICAKLGWINGYPDGTFRPDKNVTRAELMAMINRATGRAPKSADAFLPGMKTWIDNTSDKWYYLDVQEATNSHSYTVKGSETWTALTSDPNWSLYE